MDFPPAVRKVLDKYGNLPIQDITLYREPINSAINFLLNTLSLGKLQQAKKEANIDKLFHLYAIVTIGGMRFILEKNEVINLAPYNGPNRGESFRVNTHGKKFTLNDMFGKAIKKFGPVRIFTYSPITRNCQVFLTDLLDAEQLLSSFASKFINQPVEKLFEKVPTATKWIQQATTDLANRFHQVVHGQGASVWGRKYVKPDTPIPNYNDEWNIPAAQYVAPMSQQELQQRMNDRITIAARQNENFTGDLIKVVGSQLLKRLPDIIAGTNPLSLINKTLRENGEDPEQGFNKSLFGHK